MQVEVFCRETGRDALSDVCHTHDNLLELIQILSGSGKVIAGKRVFSFEGHTLFLIDGAAQHYICPDEGAVYMRNKLVVEKALVASALGDRLQGGVLQRILTPEHAEEIDREFALAEGLSLEDGNRLLLLSEVFKLLYMCTDTANDSGVRYRGTVADVITYIHENLAEGITLSEVADALHINKHYLCRLFKRETGVTVNAYITSARIARARHLLRTTAHSVTYIAEETGFADLSVFTKNFKREMNMTPSAYRAQARL